MDILNILGELLNTFLIFIGGWKVGGFLVDLVLWKKTERVEYIKGNKVRITELTKRTWK
jgi:hypothetical protein